MSFSIFDLAQLAKRLTASNGVTSIRLMFNNKGRFGVTDGTHHVDAAELATAFESLLTKMQEATQPQRNYTPSNAAAPHGCTACGLAQGRGLIGCAKHVNAGMAPARAAYAKLQGQTSTGTTTPNPSTIIYSSGGQVHNGRDAQGFLICPTCGKKARNASTGLAYCSGSHQWAISIQAGDAILDSTGSVAKFNGYGWACCTQCQATGAPCPQCATVTP